MDYSRRRSERWSNDDYAQDSRRDTNYRYDRQSEYDRRSPPNDDWYSFQNADRYSSDVTARPPPPRYGDSGPRTNSFRNDYNDFRSRRPLSPRIVDESLYRRYPHEVVSVRTRSPRANAAPVIREVVPRIALPGGRGIESRDPYYPPQQESMSSQPPTVRIVSHPIENRDSYYPRQQDAISSQASGVNVSAPRIVPVSQRRETDLGPVEPASFSPHEPANVSGVPESQPGRVVPKILQSPPNAGISQLNLTDVGISQRDVPANNISQLNVSSADSISQPSASGPGISQPSVSEEHGIVFHPSGLSPRAQDTSQKAEISTSQPTATMPSVPQTAPTIPDMPQVAPTMSGMAVPTGLGPRVMSPAKQKRPDVTGSTVGGPHVFATRGRRVRPSGRVPGSLPPSNQSSRNSTPLLSATPDNVPGEQSLPSPAYPLIRPSHQPSHPEYDSGRTHEQPSSAAGPASGTSGVEIPNGGQPSRISGSVSRTESLRSKIAMLRTQLREADLSPAEQHLILNLLDEQQNQLNEFERSVMQEPRLASQSDRVFQVPDPVGTNAYPTRQSAVSQPEPGVVSVPRTVPRVPKSNISQPEPGVARVPRTVPRAPKSNESQPKSSGFIVPRSGPRGLKSSVSQPDATVSNVSPPDATVSNVSQPDPTVANVSQPESGQLQSPGYPTVRPTHPPSRPGSPENGRSGRDRSPLSGRSVSLTSSLDPHNVQSSGKSADLSSLALPIDSSPGFPMKMSSSSGSPSPMDMSPSLDGSGSDESRCPSPVFQLETSPVLPIFDPPSPVKSHRKPKTLTESQRPTSRPDSVSQRPTSRPDSVSQRPTSRPDSVSRQERDSRRKRPDKSTRSPREAPREAVRRQPDSARRQPDSARRET
eukprot:481899_1